MSGSQLVVVARAVQRGVADFLTRGGAPQHESNASVPSSGTGGSHSHSGAGDTPRSHTQTQRALFRDKSTCILTGHKTALNEVAHIFPYSLGRKNPVHTRSLSTYKPNLHSFLLLFAGESITSSLEKYLLSVSRSRNGTFWTNINRLENLLTLTPLLHRMWDQCMFTLTPIGDPLASGGDLDAYDVAFHWLPRHRQSAHPDLSQVLDITTQLTEAEDEEISTSWLINQRKGERLISGSIFHLQTPDPKVYPLPHPDLLRLHAALSRVVRCAGASGEKQGDDYCGEEEDDECPLSLPQEQELEWVLKGKQRRGIMSFALRRFVEDWSSDIEDDVRPGGMANHPRRRMSRPKPARTRTAPYIHRKPGAQIPKSTSKRTSPGSEPLRRS
ncbi:hypothetical protein EV426DRAFT_606743 [Tirmania nivea]|nr:hypothetical protein EV426DRAFT_606743 [Tirmania nivea]